MANNTYERRNGVQIIAKDFITESGKKLSEQSSGEGGGGIIEGVSANQTKDILNNAVNSLFSFPLDDGDGVGLTICFSLVVKKGSDFAIVSAMWTTVFYNNGGSLQFSRLGSPNTLVWSGGNSINEAHINSGGDVTVNNMDISATILDGVVTFKFNPGNVGEDPDSIAFNYNVMNPNGIEFTFL